MLINILFLIMPFLKMNIKNSILTIINCKMSRFNLCNSKGTSADPVPAAPRR